MDETNTNSQFAWHKRHHRKWVLLGIVVLLIVWWIFGAQIWLGMATSGYQAVFLSNGQVYFGKLSSAGKFYKMSDIYYLQVTQNLQQASSDTTKAPTSTGTATNSQPNIQLIKLGSELHGPQDAMYIEHDKVLFWENMKADSKVVTAISKYQAK